MRVYGFPGQGSQYKGMAAALFDRYKEYTDIADDILGYSIRTLCVEDPDRQLSLTQFTQPALYVANVLTYMDRIASGSAVPDFIIGHSLGEYCALHVAGAFSFSDGLLLVKKRGSLMSSANGGAMAAVIGSSPETITAVLEAAGVTDVDIANINSARQTVLAGPPGSIDLLGKWFAEKQLTYIPLNVSAAFHSRYMRDAAQQFATYLTSFSFSDLKIPVISNLDARPYIHCEIKERLVGQLSNTVQWLDSIRYLMALGDVEFEEVGAGDVLTKLVRTIKNDSQPLPISAVMLPRHSGTNDSNHVGNSPFSLSIENKNVPALLIRAEQFGSDDFKKRYNLRYAYLAGAMYKGISSAQMVIQLGQAGMLGFLGSGGVTLDKVELAIKDIQRALANGQSYGVNLLHKPTNMNEEMHLVDLLLKYSVTIIEASAFMQVTPALVKYRLTGLRQLPSGKIAIKNKIIAKVSRPEVASLFLSPAPEKMVNQLLAQHQITANEAELGRRISLADDLCAESDSGGHTDLGVTAVLLPTVMRIRDRISSEYHYDHRIAVGAAGGLGSPEAIAAAFSLGADFVVTGSINQCTVEAGTSDKVKDMLQNMDIQDTAYAPAGDMFELGARVQVLRRGVFFPARANKLYELWARHSSLEDIDHSTRAMLEEKYFKRSFDQVYAEVEDYYLRNKPDEIKKAALNPKHKLALIFKWYFVQSARYALAGTEEHQVDYQVHTGPAMGAFNHWVKGTEIHSWKSRRVAHIGEKLMCAAAEHANNFLVKFF